MANIENFIDDNTHFDLQEWSPEPLITDISWHYYQSTSVINTSIFLSELKTYPFGEINYRETDVSLWIKIIPINRKEKNWYLNIVMEKKHQFLAGSNPSVMNILLPLFQKLDIIVNKMSFNTSVMFSIINEFWNIGETDIKMSVKIDSFTSLLSKFDISINVLDLANIYRESTDQNSFYLLEIIKKEISGKELHFKQVKIRNLLITSDSVKFINECSNKGNKMIISILERFARTTSLEDR